MSAYFAFFPFFLGMAVQTVIVLAAKFAASFPVEHRAPVQQFEGRLFPHPRDPDWVIAPGRVAYAIRDGSIVTVTRQSTYGGNSWVYLRVDDIVIADGARAERYLAAVEAAHKRRVIDRALESLP